MKKLFLAFIFVFSQIIFAQTAKEIINKNIEATGGLVNWKLLSSILLQGKVVLGLKEEYPVKIFQQRPNLTKTLVAIGKGESVIEAYDGKKGYAMNFATNQLQVFDDYEAQSFDTDFIDFEEKGFKAQLLGKDKIGDRVCYKVELTKNVNKTIYFFDDESFMLLREVKKAEALDFSEFKKVGNLVMPFRIESSSEKKEGDYVMLFNKIEINKEFPKKTFKIK